MWRRRSRRRSARSPRPRPTRRAAGRTGRPGCASRAWRTTRARRPGDHRALPTGAQGAVTTPKARGRASSTASTSTRRSATSRHRRRRRPIDPRCARSRSTRRRATPACKVYAPVYRQITLPASGSARAAARSPRRCAPPPTTTCAMPCATYLRQVQPRPRRSCSSGTPRAPFVLRELVAQGGRPKASVRKRLVSAILLGGNVLVKKGSDRGGDFRHLRACRSTKPVALRRGLLDVRRAAAPELRVRPAVAHPRRRPEGPLRATRSCARTRPPSAAAPGRSRRSSRARRSRPGRPSAARPSPSGSRRRRSPRPGSRPTAPTPRRASPPTGRNVLQITPQGGAPTLHALPDATWGLHLTDANIALGNLIALVRKQGAQYARR